MKQPLFFDSVLQEKIWGGKKLQTVFGYELPNDKIGEYWAISAHPNGKSIVKNGEFQGKSLDEIWTNHREVFGNEEGEVFPLLTKILDAEDWLSVQVHPDDAYGLEHEGELGKTECWYIIDAEEGAEIIYGHHANTREELAEMIAAGEWDKLLKKVPVKKGDFFYVPSGTIHAIGPGILILETQQSSDTTYRVYDFDRKDDQGNSRELHIQQSIDVTTIPALDVKTQQVKERIGDATVTTLVETDFFNVYKWDVETQLTLEKNGLYTLVSVLDGKGSIEIEGSEFAIQKGSHFLLPADISSWTFKGKLDIIASTPGK